MKSDLGRFTLEEIHSQPNIWGKTLKRLEALNPEKYPRLEAYDQVIFTGCGSTYYLSLWAARWAEMRTAVACKAVPASDLILFPEAWVNPLKKNLLVAISRSAETTETIRALREFTNRGLGEAVTITCYPDRELAQLAGSVVSVSDAQEVSIAQTRSFSSMVLGANWLIERTVPQNLPEQLSAIAQTVIENYYSVSCKFALNERIQRFFFLGSGPNYGMACEAMLKMKEMSLSYSEAYHFPEFRHGPMSMVDKNSLVIGMLSEAGASMEMGVLHDMQQKGAAILALSPGLALEDPGFDAFIKLHEGLPQGWSTVLYLPLLQLLAFERAMVKKLDPDHPHNLTSVVVLE